MLPGKKKNLLLNLEQRIEQEAQEFKRRRLKEELEKLAAEEKEAIPPPEGGRSTAG